MDSLLLSRLTKDYLNLDPSIVAPNVRYRMGWAGSLLVAHADAAAKEKKKKAIKELLSLRKQFKNLFNKPEVMEFSSAPKLPEPKELSSGPLSPPWYFSKGALDKDRTKNPSAIPYLLTETNEISQARPISGNMGLLKSLSKGKGILKQNSQGLIYLDVDNRFISATLPLLKGYKVSRPPYFNLFDSPEGAHVPVISKRERAFHYLDTIEDLGKEFSFEIEGLYSLQPFSWPEVEEVWFFKLRSDGLEALRRKHFLPPTPGGHPFHITLAVKPKAILPGKPPLPLMSINKAFIAA
jgi:hypothetical protein